MIARHLLQHAGVAAVAMVVLAAAGMPLTSALPIGLMAGCLAMVLGMGSGGHGHAPFDDTHSRGAEKELTRDGPS